jgi:hypothetical protein
MMRTGTIYKLVSKDINVVKCYVGSTDSVRNRIAKHKYNCNNVNATGYNLRLYQYIRENGGWGNWSMIEIELFEYERKPELHARERHHMEALNATLNSRVPNRTRAEHYQDNAERIHQQKNQKHSCPCGGKYTYTNKSRHEKLIQHYWYQYGKEHYVLLKV